MYSIFLYLYVIKSYLIWISIYVQYMNICRLHFFRTVCNNKVIIYLIKHLGQHSCCTIHMNKYLPTTFLSLRIQFQNIPIIIIGVMKNCSWWWRAVFTLMGIVFFSILACGRKLRKTTTSSKHTRDVRFLWFLPYDASLKTKLLYLLQFYIHMTTWYVLCTMWPFLNF